MTKTEIKKQQFREVIKMLENDFNIYNIDDEMGGRIVFCIDYGKHTFTGEYHRSYNDISITQNINLVGGGWELDDIYKASEAKILETTLQGSVDKIINA